MGWGPEGDICEVSDAEEGSEADLDGKVRGGGEVRVNVGGPGVLSLNRDGGGRAGRLG